MKKIVLYLIIVCIFTSYLFSFSEKSKCQSFSEYVFITKWGSKGNNAGEFSCPAGIAVAFDNNIYISDYYNNCIQKFNSTGNFISKWNSVGLVDGQLFSPSKIAIDLKGYIYVSVAFIGTIKKFDSNGTFISKWNENFYSSPIDITLTPEGNIFVISNNSTYFKKFTADGEFLSVLDTSNPKYASCSQNTMGIAIDSAGYIYGLYRRMPYSVINSNIQGSYVSYIQKFDPNGNFITEWGTYGSNDGEFKEDAGGIAVDKESNIYVADSNNNRIQKFDSNGKFLTKWGCKGDKDGELYYPTSIAIDLEGNVYVVDSGNYRIQKFAPVP